MSGSNQSRDWTWIGQRCPEYCTIYIRGTRKVRNPRPRNVAADASDWFVFEYLCCFFCHPLADAVCSRADRQETVLREHWQLPIGDRGNGFRSHAGAELVPYAAMPSA